MNRPKYPETVLSYIIRAMALWYFLAVPQPGLGAESQALAVGRDNPFAEIPKAVGPQQAPPATVYSSQLPEEAPELFMQTIMLKFLDATSLKVAMQKMCSEYGTIETSQENKSLIVCDTKERLHKIISEIQKADKMPRQVMVEVVIVDVQLSDETEIGVNWDILSDKTYDIGYRQNFTNRLGSTIENTANIGNATAFNTTGTGGDFSVISGTIRNVVAMLQQKRNIEILASPRVMVVSGKTASIEAVRELPYNEITNTSEGGQLSSTEFKKVGVKLNVMATLTEGNLIFLRVDSEQNVTIGESIVGQVPIIDTRNTKSELLLKDGQVVIIGGLRRQETTKQINQVPILGDIPLIGLLFKYTNTTVNNTELIVFLSPHIYEEGEPIPEDAMDKFKEIKDRPMLLLPADAKPKGHSDKFEQRLEEHTAAIEQLQQEIAKNELAEAELKEDRERLKRHLEGKAGANEQLLQDIAECDEVQNELTEHRNQLEQRIKEQRATNKQLQLQISEGKQAEGELREHGDQLQQRISEQTATIARLQLEIAQRKQAERDAAKKMLLDRIEMLQNRKDKDTTKELLSTLASLDEILSQEIEETLHSSEKVSADRKM